MRDRLESDPQAKKTPARFIPAGVREKLQGKLACYLAI
jgi:hypothetical protein